VKGVVTPLKVKPAPLTAIFEMVVEAEPEFVTVRVRDVELLTAMLPKLREVGLAERELVAAAATPVPLSVTEAEELSLSTNVTDPSSVPALVGAKTTV
jgi:hypothetical protein